MTPIGTILCAANGILHGGLCTECYVGGKFCSLPAGKCEFQRPTSERTASDGPDFGDGHDHEGFPGGCARQGCDGQSCLPTPTDTEMLDWLLADHDGGPAAERRYKFLLRVPAITGDEARAELVAAMRGADPVAHQVCFNCDTEMPKGCGGTFRNEGPEHCLLAKQERDGA